MSRDPIWDDLKEVTKAKFDADRKRFLDEASDPANNDGGWTVHTEYHWSRMVSGHRLDFWPSRKKWRFKGKTSRGDVNAFISKREALS